MAAGTQTQAGRGNLAGTVTDIRTRYERDGLWSLLARTAGAVRRRLYAKEQLVVMVKDLTTITDMTFDETVRIDELDERHLPALAAFNHRRANSKADARAAQSLERGHRGFVGFVDDELVGYYWWVDDEIEPSHSDIDRYGLDIELQPGEVYGNDFYLLEEHRGEGRAMEFLYKVESALAEVGYRALWGYVVADNKPARWLYGLRGYRPVKTVTQRRLLGRRISRKVEADA
jgi:GNAT superfamily N-acetyltransferase